VTRAVGQPDARHLRSAEFGFSASGEDADADAALLRAVLQRGVFVLVTIFLRPARRVD